MLRILFVILAATEVSLAACTLSATNLTVGSDSGTTNIWLEASPPTNTWSATANTNWLRVVAGGGTSNSDTVVFGFQINTGPMRTGTLTIAGLTLTVRQQGAAVATTLAATDVGTNHVTLHGMVTPNAGATAGVFQYSTNGGWLVSTVRTGISEYCSSRSSLSRDSAGNFYICTPDCSEIYRIAATGGVSVLPRPPEYLWGYSWRPISAIVDEDDNLYVAEFWCIRTYNVTTAVWTVFAGDPNVTQQSVDGTGTTARFRNILGMVKDSVGNFYAGCVYNIRHVTTNAVVTTLTDQGTSVGQRDGPAFSADPDIVALIDGATGIAVDDYSGNVYWSEYSYYGLHCIRKLNLDGPAMVTTLAGSDAGYADGTGSVARFQYPMNVFVDKAGTLYVVDAAMNNVIRKVTTNGVVTTLNCRDANTGSPLTFSQLVGGMMDDDGSLLVIDHGRGRIARVGYGLFEPLTVTSGSGLTGTNAVAVTNTISGLFPGTTYYYWTMATNSTSTNHGEILSFTTLSATTTMALASDRNPSGYGEDVTFTATVVTNVAGWPEASGVVVFKDGGVAICTAAVSGGVATFVTNRLELGSHSITAEYLGDFRYFGSTSLSPIVQTVYTGTPRVTTWPTADAIVYGQTLASSALSGGVVSATGTFAWVNSDIVPDIGTSLQEVVFAPMDTLRYVPTNGTVSVTVNKAAPNITVWPAAGAINAGDLLSASTLTGGSWTPTGSFHWAWPTNRLHAGTALHRVLFTPDDTNRYLVATSMVSVTINPVPTTNVLTTSRNPSGTGESVTFSVTVAPVSSNYYALTGSVTFKDGAATLGSRTLSGGTASLITNGLGAGPHTITAEYSGNTDFLGATGSLSQTVNPTLVVLRNPDTNAPAFSGTVLNTQQMVATVFKVGTGHMRLVQVALRLRCDFTGSPPSDSVRCTLYDVTAGGMPTTALAACDSSLINIAKLDTMWYAVALSGPLRDYLLEAGRTYALGISIPTAGSSTDRSIKNITEENMAYTMASGYTFLQNARSTTATPSWSTNANRFGIVLTGTEVPRTPTDTEVSADVNPSTYGASITLTATVTPDTAGGAVTFQDGGVAIGTGTVSGGSATFVARHLGIGDRDITAEYAGDTDYDRSVSSPAYVQTVIPPPIVTTLAATGVTATGATLNGRVTPQGLTTDSSFHYATNANWLVSTLAGATNASYADGIGSAAGFNSPGGVVIDGAGNVWVADTINCRIRKITPLNVVTTLAGTNPPGYADGTGSMARFMAPYSVAIDGTGVLHVADTYNHRIRQVTPAGVVTTLAGTNAGYADGIGGAAQFFRPQGVAVDSSGNVYVADTRNHCIRQITPSAVVTTLAGTTNAGYADGIGSAAQFSLPQGVAVDGAGRLVVADFGNHCIRRITSEGFVTTLAGTTNAGYADGSADTAQFNGPSGVAVDSTGNVYVADYNNHRIRRITPAGMVTTLAGTNSGYADGPSSVAQFNRPQGVAVDRAGNVYVADSSNHRIRKLANTLVAPVTMVAAQSGLTGTGTVDVHVAVSGLQPGITYYFQALAAAGGGTNCGAVLNFIPRTATTLALEAGPNPSTYGDSVTFTSTVSPSEATGTVTFKDGVATLGNGTLNSGAATFIADGLGAGSHSITAEYAGDSVHGGSINSPAYLQTVNKAAPGITAWPAASGIVAGQPLSASTLSGGSASVDGGFAWTTPAYMPPAGTAPQSVTFTPVDSGNYSNALGSVTVTVLAGRVQTIAFANGAVTFRCCGSPGERYHVERTASMAEPVVWTLLTPGTPLQVQPDGTAEFTDPNPPQAVAIVYRLVQAGE